MYDIFVCSCYYNNLSKADKRKYNYKNFVKEIEDNIFLKKKYVERYRKNNLNLTNVLINYRLKIDQGRLEHKNFDNNVYVNSDDN